MKNRKTAEFVLIVFLILFGMLLFAWSNVLSWHSNQQFVELAYSLLNGKLYFLKDAGLVYDASYYKGHYYWPLGPLPAIILMPFVFLFGFTVYQGMIQFLLLCVCFLLLFKIAIKILQDKNDALWLSFGYMFSSAFITIALIPWSWHFAQIIATLFLLGALYEYFYYKRWLIIGLFLALAVAVRMDLILAAIFFLATVFIKESSLRKKTKSALLLLAPIGISVSLLLLYNYLRFDNFFDQGYLYQKLVIPELKANREVALWSVMHIPANLYYFFFSGPVGVFVEDTKVLRYPFMVPDPWGMSIFFTSPLFIWIVNAPFRKKEVLFASITALGIAIAVFGYYGIGYIQYGYRYALDFYPFLFVLLLYAVKDKVSFLLKTIIIFSFYFNLFMNFPLPVS